MKSFIYTTDWHLWDKQPQNRVGNILEEGLLKIEELFKYARENDLTIIHGGDLFADEQPSYLVLNKLIDLFNKYHVKMYYTYSNHDLIGNNKHDENTGVHALLKAGVINELTIIDAEDYYILGIPYDANITAEKLSLNITSDKFKIVVTHNAVYNSSLPYRYADINQIKTNANLFLTGHIHQPYEIKQGNTWYVNPGCLIRRSISEKYQQPCFYVVSKSGIQIVNIQAVKPTNDLFLSTEKRIKSVVNTISDIKIEAKDVFDLIQKSGASNDVIKECISRLNKVKDIV